MPKYVYYCKKCEEEFEARHSLGKTLENCQICRHTNSLIRRPSSIFLNKKITSLEEKTKPGALVKAAIEDATRDLKEEREKLSQRDYKNDNFIFFSLPSKIVFIILHNITYFIVESFFWLPT